MIRLGCLAFHQRQDNFWLDLEWVKQARSSLFGFDRMTQLSTCRSERHFVHWHPSFFIHGLAGTTWKHPDVTTTAKASTNTSPVRKVTRIRWSASWLKWSKRRTKSSVKEQAQPWSVNCQILFIRLYQNLQSGPINIDGFIVHFRPSCSVRRRRWWRLSQPRADIVTQVHVQSIADPKTYQQQPNGSQLNPTHRSNLQVTLSYILAKSNFYYLSAQGAGSGASVFVPPLLQVFHVDPCPSCGPLVAGIRSYTQLPV